MPPPRLLLLLLINVCDKLQNVDTESSCSVTHFLYGCVDVRQRSESLTNFNQTASTRPHEHDQSHLLTINQNQENTCCKM